MTFCASSTGLEEKKKSEILTNSGRLVLDGVYQQRRPNVNECSFHFATSDAVTMVFIVLSKSSASLFFKDPQLRCACRRS